MRRVMILGGPGSGKTTLARQLGKCLDLPVIHLDQLYHGPGWTPPADDVFAARVAATAALPEWVIDGNYMSAARTRLARADTIVLLDMPRRIAFIRVVWRLLTGYGRQRSDAAEGCKERFDTRFLNYVWRWQSDKAPAVQALFEHFPGRKIVLRNRREVEQFLRTLAPPKVRA